MFVTENQIAEIAEDMHRNAFGWSLFSQSSIREIADVAQERLADLGLPTRRSLAIAIAKTSLALWHETIHQTKLELSENK
jgi:hypothetical protein